MSTISPNMNLVIPTPGVDLGPAWALDIDASLSILDQHNHSSGSGVQITPSGLNINSALSFQNNPASNLQASVYMPQSSLSTLNAVYFSGVDRYANDGSGNVIQITSGGAVNATSSGIVSGTATASFVSSVLVVNAATNTPANIQCGSILLGNNSAGSKFLTLAPPSAMAANYQLTLPAVPVSTLFVTLDSSGNFGNASGIAATQIATGAIVGAQLANGTITATQIANQTITATQIANQTITATQIANNTITTEQTTANIASSGNNNATASTTAFVLAGAVTITTNGGPVAVQMAPVLGSIGTNSAFFTSGTVMTLEVLVTMNSGGIASFIMAGNNSTGVAYWSPSACNFTDISAIGTPGSRAYQLLIRSSPLTSGTGIVGVQNMVLIAQEIN